MSSEVRKRQGTSDQPAFCTSERKGLETRPTTEVLPIDVAAIQNQLGTLTEAVATLKEQVRENGKRLDQVSMDLNGAKLLCKAIFWFLGTLGALLGIVLTAYLRHVFG
jgi:hypothetical protein